MNVVMTQAEDVERRRAQDLSCVGSEHVLATEVLAFFRGGQSANRQGNDSVDAVVPKAMHQVANLFAVRAEFVQSAANVKTSLARSVNPSALPRSQSPRTLQPRPQPYDGHRTGP